MKKLFLLALIAVAASSTQAQLRSIPAVVTDSFKVQYPNAANVEWKDKITAFMASFNLNKVKYQARYTTKGAWIQSEHPIALADLPAAVADGLKKSKYADWKVTAYYQLQLPGDKIQYHISVEKSDLNKKNLLFSNEGQLLKDSMTL
ncbi:MAG TPA: PepSY-like domain-containing protein [Chitinophagaceae bacterium]|jgi:hypothetical protein